MHRGRWDECRVRTAIFAPLPVTRTAASSISVQLILSTSRILRSLSPSLSIPADPFRLSHLCSCLPLTIYRLFHLPSISRSFSFLSPFFIFSRILNFVIISFFCSTSFISGIQDAAHSRFLTFLFSFSSRFSMVESRPCKEIVAYLRFLLHRFPVIFFLSLCSLSGFLIYSCKFDRCSPVYQKKE